ncbi:hypothetical protein KIPB_011500, partial [Kipferlia bialata]
GPLVTVDPSDAHNDPGLIHPHEADTLHARVCAMPDGRIMCYDKVLGSVYVVDLG